ncbi:MAG: hypothetical protein ACREFQ_14865, partial [Stellaceae bacterium]
PKEQPTSAADRGRRGLLLAPPAWNERARRVVSAGPPQLALAATCACRGPLLFPSQDLVRMNRLLIGTLDILNKLIAIALVASSTVSGYYGAFGGYQMAVSDPFHRAISTLIGFVIGVIAAALVSGLLAAIITIAREATMIRMLLSERPLVMR